ncbi:glucose-fructose oxidoreductase domain-containing protein 1-like [Clavelina lepadiformis]|uniref:glucose-fructose oxidoreductase domain-containing protein 1-like n=1 Tax=Clavelina lepadiformis TaxID=159417 RepID=UPI004042B907
MNLSLPGVGVFGTGLTAKATISLLRSCGFSIEAIWGRTEEDAKSLALQLKIPFYTCHIDDLLLNQRVELVCICSPPCLQSQIAVKTLGIGKNVLCEKPAGLGMADTKRMLNAAHYYPSLMSVMTYNLRFLPTFQKMKQCVDEGYIGDVMMIEVRVHCGFSLNTHFDWYHDERMGGGVLCTFGGHFIDLIYFICGQKATSVHGFLTTFQKNTDQVCGFREITSDDFCTFQMKLDGGACCTCVINNNVPGPFSYEVFAIGSLACLHAKDGVLYGKKKGVSDCLETPEILEQDEKEINVDLETIHSSGIYVKLPVPFMQGLQKFIESLKFSFLEEDDCRRWNKVALKSAATFEDALYAQTVLDSIRKSSRTSDWEQVVLPD